MVLMRDDTGTRNPDFFYQAEKNLRVPQHFQNLT